jgi:hypothetical protein
MEVFARRAKLDQGRSQVLGCPFHPKGEDASADRMNKAEADMPWGTSSGEIAVDVQEQRQPQLTRQVAKVKVRTRPWRAIIGSVLAIAAAGVSWAFGHDMKSLS